MNPDGLIRSFRPLAKAEADHYCLFIGSFVRYLHCRSTRGIKSSPMIDIHCWPAGYLFEGIYCLSRLVRGASHWIIVCVGTPTSETLCMSHSSGYREHEGRGYETVLKRQRLGWQCTVVITFIGISRYRSVPLELCH
jgi:hypothetical protein